MTDILSTSHPSSSTSSFSSLQTPSTTRSRSASQPQHRPSGASPSHSHAHLHSPSSSNNKLLPNSPRGHSRSISRSLSSNAIQKVAGSEIGRSMGLGMNQGGNDLYGYNAFIGGGGSSSEAASGSGQNGMGLDGMNRGDKAGGMGGGGSGGAGRARSSSLVTVTEVGGDELEGVVDRLGVGVNENANWVNAPGAWLIHPVLILTCKIVVDSIPNMNPSHSWTIVNLGYVLLSYIMFHSVTGIPFESSQPSGGAYDDLTLWEQIDAGAQYTPAKKWLTSVPIFLFLVSTHYVKYDPKLFFVNFAACLFVLFPKLPALHRLRFHFTPLESQNNGASSSAVTPISSRPPSPKLGASLSGGGGFRILDPIFESRKG